MAKAQRGTPTRKLGIGEVGERIIRSIEAGAHLDHELRRLLKPLIAGDAFVGALRGLCQQHYVVKTRGRYVLGPRGYAFLGRSQPQPAPAGWQVGVYVPPAGPPRRAGSCWLRIPSCECGRIVEYKAHV